MIFNKTMKRIFCAKIYKFFLFKKIVLMNKKRKKLFEAVDRKIMVRPLTLFDMGGHNDPPKKMFLTTVPKRLGGGS